MPKTSASQYEMLVDCMERNGDLSKPTTGPSGRLTNINRWEELANLLNADATGDTKTTEKWRKVWSDLKNNTKRKQARILQRAFGTGGGPASKLQLTELEDRVLNIVGPQAATGIPEVPEVGLTEEIIPAGPSQLLPPSPVAQETYEPFLEDLQSPADGSQHQPSGSQHQPGGSLQEPVVIMHEPAGSPLTRTSRRLITPRRRLSPRRGRRRGLASQENETSPVPRRRARLQTQAERARLEFMESDREWRAFYMNREQQADRLREMELAQQARWQDLFAAFLVTCNAALECIRNRNT